LSLRLSILFAIIFYFNLFAFYLYFFFFSSRRRHTRSKRDWSSDVCSSDLRFIDVATTARRNHGDSRNLRGIGLPVRRVVHVERVRRVHPSAIHEHGGTVSESQRRNQCDADRKSVV